jgi:hypothetical protein
MYSPQQNMSAPAYARSTPPREGAFPWRLLILTGALFVTIIFIYAGILFGYEPFLQNQLADVNAQLKQVTSAVAAQQSDALGVYSQLYNIRLLSQNRVYGSKLFTLLESGTLPGVRLTKADTDTTKGIVSLEGTVSDADGAVRQAAAFQNLSGVSSAQLASVRQETAGIKFKIEVRLQKGYFTQ